MSTCSDCRFFSIEDDQEVFGCCRRHPPIEEKHGTGFRFPTVASEDWCGEWRGEFMKLVSADRPE